MTTRMGQPQASDSESRDSDDGLPPWEQPPARRRTGSTEQLTLFEYDPPNIFRGLE